jgi:hypothetical protein
LKPRWFFVINLEERVRADHPLRPIKRVVDAILALGKITLWPRGPFL